MTALEQATRDLAYAELAEQVAADDMERAAFRLRRAAIAVAEARQKVKGARAAA